MFEFTISKSPRNYDFNAKTSLLKEGWCQVLKLFFARNIFITFLVYTQY